MALEPAAFSILLVEDEVLVRMAAVDMLEDLGHTVVEAATGDDALHILEKRRIDVLITDVGLPGISGVSLVAQVQRRWPAIRVIIATGYEGPALAGAADLGGEVKWLQKPYDSAGLSRILST